MRSLTAPAPRSRSLTRCTLTGPIPVSTERSGAWPCRTTRSRPSGSCTPFIRARNPRLPPRWLVKAAGGRRSQNRRQRIVNHLGLSEGNNRAILCHGVSLLREIQASFHPPRYAAFLTSPSPSFGYSSGCLASAHAGKPWRPRWSSHRRQGHPCYCELFSTLFRDFLGRTPPPLVVPSQPGFRVLASPQAVRSLGDREPGLPPAFWCQGQRALDFCRFLLMSCRSYLPLSIVRAFASSFRLGLSVRSAFRPWSASLALPTA